MFEWLTEPTQLDASIPRPARWRPARVDRLGCAESARGDLLGRNSPLDEVASHRFGL
jgi:hypothetical protein